MCTSEYEPSPDYTCAARGWDIVSSDVFIEAKLNAQPPESKS